MRPLALAPSATPLRQGPAVEYKWCGDLERCTGAALMAHRDAANLPMKREDSLLAVCPDRRAIQHRVTGSVAKPSVAALEVS